MHRPRARFALIALFATALLLQVAGACTGIGFLGFTPTDAGSDQSAGAGGSGVGGNGNGGSGNDIGSGGAGQSGDGGGGSGGFGGFDAGDCESKVDLGAFAPSVQCTWPPPEFPESDLFVNVLTTPLVADLPNDSNAAAEIVLVTYNGDDNQVNGTLPDKYGVLRILNGQTCELLETIDEVQLRASATPALADLNNDGTIEIVARRNDNGLVAYKWDAAQSRFSVYWEADGDSIRGVQAWDGPSIHDLNNDGLPEVLLEVAVYNGQTGKAFPENPPIAYNRPFNGLIPVVGDLDNDKVPELLVVQAGQVTRLEWIKTEPQHWRIPDYDERFGRVHSHFAFADFGTPGKGTDPFNTEDLDGIAEIVAVAAEGNPEGGYVSIYTLSGETVLELTTPLDGDPTTEVPNEGGGPPTIGDFDGDGFPEIAVAGATMLRVIDPGCPDCETPYVLWAQPSQDASSRQTGASVFDFDGDGLAELVYADECFLRIYRGHSGEVLYSAYRTSGTWYESPVIADVDKDDNTEIIVNSNTMNVQCGEAGTPYIDPLHVGVPCRTGDDCVSGVCESFYCRCTSDAECGKIEDGLVCAAPPPQTQGTGKTCRSQHPNSAEKHPGIRVLRDKLDRWASSRPLWNQHAYSITNIEDDGKVPQTEKWQQNFADPERNNYRQNSQGIIPGEQLPDIYGKLKGPETCQKDDGSNTVVLYGQVCNQGRKGVGAALPGAFYAGSPSDGDRLCVSYTDGPVPAKSCKKVRCEPMRDVRGIVTMVVNDDGNGGRTTVECNYDNNTSTTEVEVCPPIRCGGGEFPCPMNLTCVNDICVQG